MGNDVTNAGIIGAFIVALTSDVVLEQNCQPKYHIALPLPRQGTVFWAISAEGEIKAFKTQ
jgi:hypothetical protein